MANTEDSRHEPVISDVPERALMAQMGISEVVLIDIDIPFSRAVSIMTKWILASIPAVALATLIVYAIIIFFGAISVSIFPEFFGIE